VLRIAPAAAAVVAVGIVATAEGACTRVAVWS